MKYLVDQCQWYGRDHSDLIFTFDLFYIAYDKECEKMLGVLLKLAKIAIWTTQSWQKYKSTPDFYSVE